MKKSKGRDENKVEYGTISLPIPLIERIKERIKGTGMPSVSAYIAFILREVLSNSKPNTTSTIKEVDEVKKRLRNLGY